MYKAACLIAYRRQNAARQRNLEFLLGLLHAIEGIEIVVVEQDSEPRLPVGTRSGINYQFAYNPGLFNKAWALNIAAREAKAAILVFMDADILLEQDGFEQMLQRLGSDADAVSPYDTFFDLDESETLRLMEGDLGLVVERREDEINRRSLMQRSPFCGGVFGVTRALYDRVGGLDERFVGWGGEDDAMTARLEHFAHNMITLDQSHAYHLWHPPSTEPEELPSHFLRNLAMYTLYRENLRDDFFTRLARADSGRNGARDRYRHTPPIPTDHPLVSCLCVTRGRVDLLARAIACFQHQTWANRELLVVCEDDDPETIRFLGQIDDEQVRALVVPTDPKLALGALRNLSIEQARGQYICQWDDDDWYHPQRLARQLGFLQQSGKAACVLARWMIYATEQRESWVSNLRLWEGSLLCRRDILRGQVQYSNAATGEDSHLIVQLYILDEIDIYDQPDLYVYIHSGRNTWDDAHFRRILDASSPLDEAGTLRLAGMIGVA